MQTARATGAPAGVRPLSQLSFLSSGSPRAEGRPSFCTSAETEPSVAYTAIPSRRGPPCAETRVPLLLGVPFCTPFPEGPSLAVPKE